MVLLFCLIVPEEDEVASINCQNMTFIHDITGDDKRIIQILCKNSHLFIKSLKLLAYC